MDPVMTMLLIRGVLCIGLLAGGFASLYYGFKAYRSGNADGDQGFAFELGEVKASAKTVGSVVMATACIWAGFSYLARPTFVAEGGNVNIGANNDDPTNDVDSNVWIAEGPFDPESQEDVVHFMEGLSNMHMGETSEDVKVMGHVYDPGLFKEMADTSSIKKKVNASGEVVWSVPSKDGTDSMTITISPRKVGAETKFEIKPKGWNKVGNLIKRRQK